MLPPRILRWKRSKTDEFGLRKVDTEVGSDILIRGQTEKLEGVGGGGKLIIGQFYFWRERGEGIWSDSEDIFMKLETQRVPKATLDTLVLIRPLLKALEFNPNFRLLFQIVSFTGEGWDTSMLLLVHQPKIFHS